MDIYFSYLVVFCFTDMVLFFRGYHNFYSFRTWEVGEFRVSLMRISFLSGIFVRLLPPRFILPVVRSHKSDASKRYIRAIDPREAGEKGEKERKRETGELDSLGPYLTRTVAQTRGDNSRIPPRMCKAISVW